MRRPRLPLLLGLLIVAAVALAGLLGPALAAHDPIVQDLGHRFVPPVWMEGGSGANLLGTDQLGRDYLSRLLLGARISLVIGLVTVVVSGLIGTALGVAGGCFGGRTDRAVMFVISCRLAIPLILVALTVVSLAGSSTTLFTYTLPSFPAAVQSDLRAVGITLNIQQLQVGAEVEKVMAGQTPTNLGTWGSNSVNDVSAVLPYFFGGGSNDYARDAEVQKELHLAGAETAPEKRQEHYTAAIRRITEQAYWLPLLTSVTQYAFAKAPVFTPYPDELPRFYLSRWS